MNLRTSKPWDPAPGDAPVIGEGNYFRRRELLKALGLGGALAASGLAYNAVAQEGATSASKAPDTWTPSALPPGGADLYPAARNEAFDPGRKLTPEGIAGRYNNFYEFYPSGAGEVWKYVDKFNVRPWTITIAGEVEKEREVDLDDIAKIAPLEERLYRFRCVERWSMTVPWIGLPMAKFVEWCKPTSAAKFVRFVSFKRPEEAPGQKQATHYPWPYYEGLSMAEATHPLTLLVTGIFGHGLPVQHGAPVRAIVPWKYGYKSPKSFVRVEFTKEQPPTFWSDLQPSEYPFESNVEPDVPHKRWPQNMEWDLETKANRPTLPYNGYAREVAHLYG